MILECRICQKKFALKKCDIIIQNSILTTLRSDSSDNAQHFRNEMIHMIDDMTRQGMRGRTVSSDSEVFEPKTTTHKKPTNKRNIRRRLFNRFHHRHFTRTENKH